ncbi:MAG: glycosyltransferase family 39 protein [Ferruginibacter sp.]
MNQPILYLLSLMYIFEDYLILSLAKNTLPKTTFFVLLGLVVFLNATGVFNDILEPDGTLYASIARHLVKSNNWMDLWGKGADWLDKPHMPFWLAAISLKLIGINAFAYKLPSFIFFIVSLIYAYKLTVCIYNEATARLAVLIYASSLHIIISNFDGKAEIYLAAFIIAAIYHIYKAIEKKWLYHIVLGALFCACAVMTKGLFSLITIAAGFVIYWIKTKQWNEFFNPKWYVLLLLVMVFILPELYSLYTQFDLHPEKIVFGKTNVSGLKFFFWDSQFGRFFNNGPIKGSGDPLFFIHTTLWAFLPSTILFLYALSRLFLTKKTPARNDYRWMIGGSAFTTFLIFSLSKFQLPHYIIILFPHFSMITAAWLLETAAEKTLKKINAFQTILFVLLIAVIVWIMLLYRFENITWFVILLVLISMITFFYKPENMLVAILKKNIGFALLIAVFLNCLLYPSILQYQSGMMAAKWLNGQPTRMPVVFHNCEPSSLDFYYHGNVRYTTDKPFEPRQIASNDSSLLFASLSSLKALPQDTLEFTVLKTFPHFRVSKLNIRFLNHQTRSAELDTFALAIVKRKTYRN